MNTVIRKIDDNNITIEGVRKVPFAAKDTFRTSSYIDYQEIACWLVSKTELQARNDKNKPL